MTSNAQMTAEEAYRLINSLWFFDVILKSGIIMEAVGFRFDFSEAMKEPGYFRGAITHEFDRIWDSTHGIAILYGEIAAWKLISKGE